MVIPRSGQILRSTCLLHAIEGVFPSWGRNIAASLSFLHLFWEFRTGLMLSKVTCLPSASWTLSRDSLLYWTAIGGGGKQKNIFYLHFILWKSLITWLSKEHLKKKKNRQHLRHPQTFSWKISLGVCMLTIGLQDVIKAEYLAWGKVRITKGLTGIGHVSSWEIEKFILHPSL